MTAARAALAAGRTLEATERLEEACRLDPEALEARLLLEQMRTAESVEPLDFRSPEPVAAGGLGKWSHWIAAVIAVAALAALALLRPLGPDESRATPPRERAQPAVGDEVPANARLEPAPPVVVPATPSTTVPLTIEPTPAMTTLAEQRVAPPASELDRPVGTGGSEQRARRLAGSGVPAASRSIARAESPGAGGEADGPQVTRPASAGPPPEQGSQASLSLPPVTPGTTIPDLAAMPRPNGVLAPPETAAAAAITAGGALPPGSTSEAATGAGEVAATKPATIPRTDPAPAAFRGPTPDEEEIGRTLQGYADAYQRLDAAAARRVWPSVDQRALARAFAGLESQGISFERCETEVAGAEARAVCRGRARYVPKVGSREPLTMSRQWTFRLQRAGDSWQIVSAEAR